MAKVRRPARTVIVVQDCFATSVSIALRLALPLTEKSGLFYLHWEYVPHFSMQG